MFKRITLGIDSITLGGQFEKAVEPETFQQSPIDKFESSTFIASDDFEIGGVFIQKGQELHYVLGVVLEPETIDGTTTEKSMGDIYSEDEVRKAAYHFMANYGGKGNDYQHNGANSPDLMIVESYIAPVDMTINKQSIKKGTWLMGTLVLDAKVWKEVKEGNITGYSIGGVTNARFEEIATSV